ncbi:MAG: hypothetical protein Q8O92_06110 [Candidatus Latescibacter sp.]|nr:hypothetical protein [Candidatus Latescibacter sp.]
MEPENIHRKPIWDRISGKYPYFGGYFPPQGIFAAWRIFHPASLRNNAMNTLSGSGAFCKAWTGSAQRTVKGGAGLPHGQVMSGFQRRMTCRTTANAFCERVREGRPHNLVRPPFAG